MNIYKLKISYNGGSFEGWQVQPKGHRTVQGELNRVLEKITKGEVSTLGSGRTDSGVHALGQVVRVSTALKIEAGALKNALNSQLPKEIRVLEAFESDKTFHPVRDALWKQYDYLLFCGDVLPPFYEGLWTHNTFQLNLNLMKDALKVFEGEHDFINFSTKGTEVSSTTRTVFKAGVEKLEISSSLFEGWSGELYKFSFVGEGFLKQMVRLLVGAAINAGRGKIQPLDIASYLKEEKSDKCAPVAPADGLYLKHVEYLKSWPLDD